MRRGATNVYVEDKSHKKSLCHVNPQSSYTVNAEVAFGYEFNSQWQKSQYIW
jgi:hypothetical protein